MKETDLRYLCLDWWRVKSHVGFPGGANGKESICQCRRRKRHGFDPWVGKIPWSKKWQPTPVFLLGKFHGQRCTKLDMTEQLNTQSCSSMISPRVWGKWSKLGKLSKPCLLGSSRTPFILRLCLSCRDKEDTSHRRVLWPVKREKGKEWGQN